MAGLFSSDEQDMLGTIMQQRDKSNQALGSGYGKYGGIVQAGAGMADIGGDAMFGGATGASDPRMIEQQEVKAIFSQAATQTGNSTSPEFFTALSELLAAKFPEQSQKAMEQADVLGQRKFRDKEQTAKVLSMENDTKAKEAVASLPDNASSEQILAAVRPFVGVDSVYKGVLDKEEKLAAKAAKADELKLRHEQRMDEIASQNASREQIAAENARFRAEMAQSQNELRRDTLALRRDTLNAKNGTLPATLQKSEQADLEQYDSRGDEIALMNKALTELRGTEGQKPLVLGPFQNKKYEAQNATGFSSPESRRYAGIQSAYKTAVNTKVSAEKGVQTDKDVVRFAEALIAAYSGNDFEALQKATVDYTVAVKRSRNTLQKRIQGRRKNAGTPFYDFGLQDGETPEATSGTTKTTASGVKYTVR